jgi:hypothetical protein
MVFREQHGDGLAAPGDMDGLTLLRLVNQACKLGLGLGNRTLSQTESLLTMYMAILCAPRGNCHEDANPQRTGARDRRPLWRKAASALSGGVFCLKQARGAAASKRGLKTR